MLEFFFVEVGLILSSNVKDLASSRICLEDDFHDFSFFRVEIFIHLFRCFFHLLHSCFFLIKYLLVATLEAILLVNHHLSTITERLPSL